MAEDLQVKGLTQNAEAKQIRPPPPIQPVVELLEEEPEVIEEPVVMPSRPGRKRKSSAKENSPKKEKKEIKEEVQKGKRRGGRKAKKEVEPEPEPESEPEPEQLIIKPEPVDLHQQIVDTSAIEEDEAIQYNIEGGYDSFSKDTSDPGFENIENLSMAEFLAEREPARNALMGHVDPALMGHVDLERDQNGSIFACEECDYQSPRKYNLSKHVESVHQGVRHPCNHCDYKATNRSNLKTHVRKKHIMVPIHGES